jgi:predicted O-methyltransferase YrrM
MLELKKPLQANASGASTASELGTRPSRQTEAELRPPLPQGDYVSPNLDVVLPDSAFPHLIRGDVSASDWPYLRKEVPHTWYVDSRNPTVGFVSRDEAAILYNTARQFHGKPCLEIGCWRGWSTVHLALGAGNLDVIDPLLNDPTFFSDVRTTCCRAGLLDSVTFYGGFSPAAVEELAKTGTKRWSFIFIDGDHEGSAPLRDTEAVVRHATDDAMVIFHDLVSPNVAAGLDYLRTQGWNTRIYQTMQIMGVAWRGHVDPIDHEPDPLVRWTTPPHLADYEVSSWEDRHQDQYERERRLRRERDQALARAAASEQDFAALAGRIAELSQAAHNASALDEQLGEARRRIAELEHNLASKQEAIAQTQVLERDFAELAQRIVVLSKAARDASLFDEQLKIARDETEAMRGHLGTARYRIGQLQQQVEAEQKAGSARVELLMKHVSSAAREAEVAIQVAVEAAKMNQWTIVRGRAIEAAQSLARHESRHGPIRALAEWICETRVLLGLLRRPGLIRISLVQQKAELLGLDSLINFQVGHLLCRRRMIGGLLRRSVPSRVAIVVGILLDFDCTALTELRKILADLLSMELAQAGPTSTPLSFEEVSLPSFEKLIRDSGDLQRRFIALEQAKLVDEAALLDARLELAKLRAERRSSLMQATANG